jgi:hypothetical protein
VYGFHRGVCGFHWGVYGFHWGLDDQDQGDGDDRQKNLLNMLFFEDGKEGDDEDLEVDKKGHAFNVEKVIF